MKISLSRVFEISKYLATDAGKELSDVLQYLSDFAENVIRALQNNLTFADNFNAKATTLTLKHDVAQVVNTDGKRPVGILPMQAVSATTGVDSLIWYVNNAGQVVIKVGFVGAPTTTVDLVVAILFP